VGFAAILAATRLTHVPLRDQRVVIVGAGARGVGTAHAIRDGLTKAGVEGDRLRRAVALVDRQGLLVEGSAVLDFQRPFAWPSSLAESGGLGRGARDLGSVVRALRPTVIVGACGQPGVLREGLVRLMATHVPRPVVLTLSGSSSRPEARPEDVLAWTQGRALVATASPSAPAVYSGHPSRVAQASNAFILPGVGLGALVAEAREITDSMFTVAAETLAAALSDSDLETGALFPPLLGLRTVAVRVAEAVVREARGAGLGRWIEDEDIPAAVQGAMWKPDDPTLDASAARERR
jgi:malate dehydrogenase (oxaloacetate-decarboxylating)